MINWFWHGLKVRVPLYHPSPNVSRPVTQLTEDEQVKIAKRIGLIQHLPSGIYDGTKKVKEYVHADIIFDASLNDTALL